MGETSICLGAIVAAHGVKGAVKVTCFTETPEAITAYGPLTDESGKRQFKLEVIGPSKGGVLARVAGVNDRNAAEALKSTRLYVPRAALPRTDEEEFYHADLIGLVARWDDGAALGRVLAVHNYGAGDVLEISREGAASLMVPFTRDAVPQVDLAASEITVTRLPGLLEDAA
jgi:16S rRNA processing protein RimM